MGADESCFWRIWISQDVNKSLETLLTVYSYADILVEGALRAIECPLAWMNVFLHYCLTFSANDCVFSLNEIQKMVLRDVKTIRTTNHFFFLNLFTYIAYNSSFSLILCMSFLPTQVCFGFCSVARIFDGILQVALYKGSISAHLGYSGWYSSWISR